MYCNTHSKHIHVHAALTPTHALFHKHISGKLLHFLAHEEELKENKFIMRPCFSNWGSPYLKLRIMGSNWSKQCSWSPKLFILVNELNIFCIYKKKTSTDTRRRRMQISHENLKIIATWDCKEMWSLWQTAWALSQTASHTDSVCFFV